MYVLKHSSGYFYCGQNLYMGTALLTLDINTAAKMSLDDAERTIACMTEQGEWKIYGISTGLRLADESDRHIRRARKRQLEKELESLSDV